MNGLLLWVGSFWASLLLFDGFLSLQTILLLSLVPFLFLFDLPDPLLLGHVWKLWNLNEIDCLTKSPRWVLRILSFQFLKHFQIPSFKTSRSEFCWSMSCYHVNVEMSGCTEQCRIVYLKGSFFFGGWRFPAFWRPPCTVPRKLFTELFLLGTWQHHCALHILLKTHRFKGLRLKAFLWPQDWSSCHLCCDKRFPLWCSLYQLRR